MSREKFEATIKQSPFTGSMERLGDSYVNAWMAREWKNFSAAEQRRTQPEKESGWDAINRGELLITITDDASIAG
jgi:hypothetical protein